MSSQIQDITDKGVGDEIISKRRLEFNEADIRHESVDVITIEDGGHDANGFITDEDGGEDAPNVIPGDGFMYDELEITTEEKIPRVGMEFDSEADAYRFYNEYAKSIGFGIRRHHVHKDKHTKRILDRIFCCECQGERVKDKRDPQILHHRPISRTGCGAKMKINGRGKENYSVVEFVAEHTGHDLVSPKKAHMIRSHRKITSIQASQADDLESSGIAPKEGFALMSKQVGGRENVGFTLEDYRNYLGSKRTMEMNVDDTRGVLEYMQRRQCQDPNFFYTIQVDEDALITNILWIDARMKSDYSYFGDVVSFDTTFRKNKESGRPFALFVGVNHHKQTIIFGASLMFDETASSFIWLFDSFAKAMDGKKPQTILTDQDAAMSKALAAKWPETYHRLCIWHIYKNAATNLSTVFASFKSFSKEFRSCIYDYEEEDEFLLAWRQMLEKFGLQNNEWLIRLFKIKEKWALVYGRRTFCADMTTTQRSESMHSALKKYVSYKHHLLQFFCHFDRLIEDHRYKEAKADLMTSKTRPVSILPVLISKHAASVYTHEVFLMFEEELQLSYDSKFDSCDENGEIYEYKVSYYGKHHSHKVTFQPSQCIISCGCKKFEFAGIVCSHILAVLSWRNITVIPEIYILKRWTKEAKKSDVEAQLAEVCADIFECNNEIDEKELHGRQYRELCRISSQLAVTSAFTSKNFQTVKRGLLLLLKEVQSSSDNTTSGSEISKPNSTTQRVSLSKVIGKQSSAYETREEEVEANVEASSEILVKGWKTKESNSRKSGKRLKSGLEKNQRRKKHITTSVQSGSKDQLQKNMHQSNVPPSCSSLLSMSQIAQGNQLCGINSSNTSQVEASSITNVGFHAPQMMNPNVSEEFNFIPSYEHHHGTGWMQLLQQQLIKPPGFGNPPNSFISGSQQENGNEEFDDVRMG